jgi:hypothetical protein
VQLEAEAVAHLWRRLDWRAQARLGARDNRARRRLGDRLASAIERRIATLNDGEHACRTRLRGQSGVSLGQIDNARVAINQRARALRPLAFLIGHQSHWSFLPFVGLI